MWRVFCTTLYRKIILEYNVSEHSMITRSTFFFKFLEFTSLNMRTSEWFLYFWHKPTTQVKGIYSEVNNNEKLGIRKVYSWKDINTFILVSSLFLFLFIILIHYSYSRQFINFLFSCTRKVMTINHQSNFTAQRFCDF